MTAEQLEDLLGKVTQGEWRSEYDENYREAEILVDGDNIVQIFSDGRAAANATLIALAPSLARRVIAAEKLVEAWFNDDVELEQIGVMMRTYREASK